MSSLQPTTAELLQAPELLRPSTGLVSWFAVQTRPKFENKVAAQLLEKGVETFLPSKPLLRQWSDRQRVIHAPLFPGYVFVRSAATLDARVSVLRTNGVISFVGVRGLGIPIPEEEITAVQTLLAQKIPFEAYPFLKVGQRVRIRGGSLDGIKGILTAIRGDQSLIISVELIQRSIAMRVSGYLVEPE